jgi:phosphodiesterase/alkaline phosphatase D-like protein
VTSYRWNFGDGTPPAVRVSTVPAATHTYTHPGTYTATLTTTNEGGCASTFVYTGRTASCTGTATATTTRTVAIRSPDPSARTRSARAVARTRATLRGTIRPAGQRLRWHFEYGRLRHYRRATPGKALRARHGRVAVRARLSGLSPHTRYHYRLVISTRGGVVASSGRDATLLTLSGPRS